MMVRSSLPARAARPGALRAAYGALAPTPEIGRIVKRLGNHRLSQPQLRHLANLEPDPIVEDTTAENNHSEPPSRRELTPRQLALWKAGAARQGPRALPARNRPPIGHLTQYGPQVRSLPDPADQSSTQPRCQTTSRTGR